MIEDPITREQVASRIHATCKGNLVWYFEFAYASPTWSKNYDLDGAPSKKEPDFSATSHVVQGSFQFLKLCLYHETWDDRWEFVLHLLHLKLEQWLDYLENTRHMGHLWVEGESSENFRPFDTSGEHGDYGSKWYPFYLLADASVTWQALFRLERLVDSIEDQVKRSTSFLQEDSLTKFRDIKDWLSSHRDTLSLQGIRSSIFEIFKHPRNSENTRPVHEGKFPVGLQPLMSNTDQDEPITVQALDKFPISALQSTDVDTPTLTGCAHGQTKQSMLLGRGIIIEEEALNIQDNDFPALDAAIDGLFDMFRDQARAAWLETIRLQQDRNIHSFEQPREVAMTLWAFNYGYVLARASGASLDSTGKARLTGALYDSGFFAGEFVTEAQKPVHIWSRDTFETMLILLESILQKEPEKL